MKIIRQITGVLLFAAILGAAMLYNTHQDALLKRQTIKDAVFDLVKGEVRKLEQERIQLERDEVALKRARIQAKKESLPLYTDLKYYSLIAIVASACASVLIYASLRGKADVIAASVHDAKIGDSVIPLHIREIKSGRLAEQLTALTTAEKLKQGNAGIEKAMEIYVTLADVQTQQFRALRGLLPAAASQSDPSAPGAATVAALPAAPVPSFHDLVTHGDIAPGKPMILGYHEGEPKQGSFLDIYSSAVAGESGSGKTGTLLYLTGSGIVADGVRFLVIDPHYPHPKSLAYKLKPLWDAGLVQVSTTLHEAQDTLQRVETMIDRRLKQLDTDTTPVVLVIDELAFLNKTSIKTPLAHTMERISTEGRKCAVYMLASSQTWLVARTGDSSVVRDTLTSAFVHSIKPKQANLLLQDTDEAQKVKKYCKHPGEALLCPVGGDSTVVKIPFTTVDDMRLVANMGTSTPVVNVDHSAPCGYKTVDKAVDNAQSPVDKENTLPVDLVERIRTAVKSPDFSLRKLAQQVGVDVSYLSRGLRGGTVSLDCQRKLSAVLIDRDSPTVITGPWPQKK